jgi:cytochrome c2
VARFQRDESRTFKFLWFLAGGTFAAVSVWAMYDDGVTRVPWQVQQKNFYGVEQIQATNNLARTEAEFAAHSKAADDKLKARKAQIEEQEKPGGSFAKAHDKVDDLSRRYAEAEQKKTFAKSDLDEAYYYRQLAEYARDEAMNKAREALGAAPGGPGLVEKLLGDPPPPDRTSAKEPEGGPAGPATDLMYHLLAERDRNAIKAKRVEEAKGSIDAHVWPAVEEAMQALQATVARVDVEIKHQLLVDNAEKTMADIDGPADPAASIKDEKAAFALRKEACAHEAGGPDASTRHCIQWLQLDPITAETALIDRQLAKLERPLVDAKLRLVTAGHRANPKFEASPGKLIDYVVGVYQIQQQVTSWNEAEADVEKQQVDRCSTCHMGADSANYTDPSVARQFRTHPFRSTLFASHPIEKFGCTSCHQGEGRATDLQAHSQFRFTNTEVGPRWEYFGDKFWEDPLYPTGKLYRTVIDSSNDELQLKVDAKGSPGDWTTVNIGSPTGPKEYADETVFVGALKDGAQKAVAADIAANWEMMVRKLDGRITIGLDQKDPTKVIEDADKPTLRVKFTKPGLAEILGFTGELYEHASSYTATHAPSIPVRSPGEEHWDAKGRYTPPSARTSLQILPEYRDRFILSLPEIEGSCYRCHGQDTDLRPRNSKAKWIFSNLDREKAAKQPHAADEAEAPEAGPDPFTQEDPVPSYSEGRHLFRQLNCTGCHILDGFPGNRNTGPQLNDITAKTNPAWILKWIRYPRAWRHKTKMPTFWPSPIDPAAKVPYEPGSPEYAIWEKQMKEQSLDLAAFLIDRSERPDTRPSAKGGEKRLADTVAGYANVPGASAEDGKAIVEAYGCRGCHATAEENLPPAWRKRERDIAPDLVNVGSKMSEDWIAYWVENPSRYWHGTKMPMLRLDRREAASVAKYLITLKDEPKGTAEVSSSEVAVLTDGARRHEKVKCDIAGNSLMTRVECGEKLVANYGCFGCHQIDGFESYAPIAPELNNWAKKDLSQLDYGYAIDDHHQQTHETFATWKLDSPRIYRRDRIELRMGDFDLSAREIRSLVVFLMGLNDLKPTAEYNPYDHPEYRATIEGRQAVEDYNCRGCHLIEGKGADFLTARRQTTPEFDEQLGPPHLTGEGARVQPEWLFGFLRAPGDNGIRPPLHPEWVYGEAEPVEKLAVKMPTFPFSSEQATSVVRYFAAQEGADYPYVAAKVKDLEPDERMDALLHLNSSNDTGGNCISCHFVGAFPVERGKTELEKMGPSLGNVYKRLRPEWTQAWISKPSNWLPYTKMPAFWPDPYGAPLTWTLPAGFAQPKTAEGQIALLRDYLYLFREHTKLPPPGQEGKTPVLGLGGDDAEKTAEAPGAAPNPPPAPAPGGRPRAPGGPTHGALETVPHTF